MSDKPTYEELEKRVHELEQAESERMKAVLALKESEGFFQDMVEKLPFPVVVGTADYKTEYANPKFTEILGYTAEDIPDQKAWREKFFPDLAYRAEISCEVDNWIAENDTEVTFSRCYTDKWGREHDMVVHVLNVKDLFYNIFIDITERKRAEEKIARFARIFEDSLNEIYLFKTDTLRFTQVNTAAQRNTGYTTEEFKNLTPLDLNPEITLETFREMITPLLKGEKEKIVFETFYSRKDKSQYYVEVHLQLLKHDQEILFAAIILDITERKLAEAEIKILRGFLPICANCKKIRDDKGYWNQIESYIRDHTEVEFSHSICPKCAKKLYPDLAIESDNTNS